MTEPQSTGRRPFRGSCHCGLTKYIVFLDPPTAKETPSDPEEACKGHSRFYRCNCSTCHKASIFHTRPADPSNDFLLLSPLDPLNELGDYRAFEKQISFFFCKTCGGRCFSLGGTGEVVEVDLGEVLGEGSRGEKTKVWKVRREGPAIRGDKGPYLSVNAHSIEVDQGLDMRELTGKKLVEYMDCRSPWDSTEPVRYDYPYAGGSF